MKYLRYTLVVIALAAILTACGFPGQGTPQPSLAELQATAMAQAQAEIALTQAAMPTDTPLPTNPPATDTPMPTPTLVVTNTPVVPMTPVPTIVATVTTSTDSSAASSGAKTDYCNTTALSTVKGPHVNVNFKADKHISGFINLYLYMTETAFGCGYGNLQMSGGDSESLSLPQGCYAFYGWIEGAHQSITHGNDICFYRSDPTLPDQVYITANTVTKTTP